MAPIWFLFVGHGAKSYNLLWVMAPIWFLFVGHGVKSNSLLWAKAPNLIHSQGPWRQIWVLAVQMIAVSFKKDATALRSGSENWLRTWNTVYRLLWAPAKNHILIWINQRSWIRFCQYCRSEIRRTAVFFCFYNLRSKISCQYLFMPVDNSTMPWKPFGAYTVQLYISMCSNLNINIYTYVIRHTYIYVILTYIHILSLRKSNHP